MHTMSSLWLCFQPQSNHSQWSEYRQILIEGQLVVVVAIIIMFGTLIIDPFLYTSHTYQQGNF